MLRASSKIVRQKLRQYITDDYNDKANDVDNYWDYVPNADFHYICKWYLSTFIGEKLGWSYDEIRKSLRFYKSYAEAFDDWCCGLPTFHTDDWILGSNGGIDFLGDLLEETEYERNQYDNMDAVKMINALMYNELVKGCSLSEAIEFAIESHKNRRY